MQWTPSYPWDQAAVAVLLNGEQSEFNAAADELYAEVHHIKAELQMRDTPFILGYYTPYRNIYSEFSMHQDVCLAK